MDTAIAMDNWTAFRDAERVRPTKPSTAPCDNCDGPADSSLDFLTGDLDGSPSRWCQACWSECVTVSE